VYCASWPFFERDPGDALALRFTSAAPPAAFAADVALCEHAIIQNIHEEEPDFLSILGGTFIRFLLETQMDG
jgi:hypothetical protein